MKAACNNKNLNQFKINPGISVLNSLNSRFSSLTSSLLFPRIGLSSRGFEAWEWERDLVQGHYSSKWLSTRQDNPV